MIEIIITIIIVLSITILLAGYYALFIFLCVEDVIETKKQFLLGLIPFYLLVVALKKCWNELD